MEKKTVNLSQQFINSAIAGFILSFLIIIIAHFFPIEWRILYDKFTGYGDSTVGLSNYECALHGKHFHDFTGMNVTVGNQTRDFKMIIADSFDGHGLLIFIIGLMATVIIYLLKKFEFKLIDD